MKALFVTICILTIISFIGWNHKDTIIDYVGDDLYEIGSCFIHVLSVCLGVWLLYWILLV